MRFLSKLLLLMGISLMVIALIDSKLVQFDRILGVLGSMGGFCVSMWNEFDANVEARKAWLAKCEIRRAELYYCEEPKDEDWEDRVDTYALTSTTHEEETQK